MLPVNGATQVKEPTVCSDWERREFARLVRQGFPAAERLDRRILDARLLAFHYATADTLVAVAALKAPNERYRDDVFQRAGAAISPADYELELGWVFVVPAHRGNRIAAGLCQRLLARVSASCVFATTRPNNTPMIRILRTLGIARVGKPYPRRDEQLALFLRCA